MNILQKGTRAAECKGLHRSITDKCPQLNFKIFGVDNRTQECVSWFQLYSRGSRCPNKDPTIKGWKTTHTRGTAATCTPGVHFLVLICAFLMSIKNFRNGIPLVKSAASQHHGCRNRLLLVKSKSPTCEQFPSAFINPICSEIQQSQPAAAKSRLCANPQTAALGFSRQEHWSGSPFPSPMHQSQK